MNLQKTLEQAHNARALLVELCGGDLRNLQSMPERERWLTVAVATLSAICELDPVQYGALSSFAISGDPLELVQILDQPRGPCVA